MNDSLRKDELDLSEDAQWDPSRRAEAVLEHILQTEADAPEGQAAEARVPVQEAIAARPIIDRDTGRSLARVLFVTTDERVLSPGGSLQRDYLALAEQLDEAHVFCLVPRRGEEKFERVGRNLWIYQIRRSSWWRLSAAAKEAASEALTWNGVFRPDVVVGIDAFEAGLAAYRIAKRFSRPLQLHVHTDPFDPEYKSAAPDNNWRVYIARFLLKRAKSVRVPTGLLKDALAKRYRRLKDIAVLPRFYNFSGIVSATPSLDLHRQYPDFAFIMLVFGTLTADGQLHDVFASLHRFLRNSRVGLVVVGDGPAKQLFADKVKLLGIEKNVVFKPEAEDLASYLKTADLLIEVGGDEEAEVRVLQAASAGVPMVISSTNLRRDLFKDGESAFLCEPGDLVCVSQKVSKFMNTAGYRAKFSQNAAAIAKDRVREDPAGHYRALALTIESVLVAESA